MKLVIVESPTKAKTISRFLKNGFKVLSSYGHVRDLPQKELGVDVEKNFKPIYVIIPKAQKHVLELKKEAKKADGVILATDEDREGEAIAWHLIQALGLNEIKNQKSRLPSLQRADGQALPAGRQTKIKNIERIVFHEVTKKAIEEALNHPREIDMNLVNAQQARRILDRLVGYKLSPFLWEKVRRGLSAGRVQSVAVRLICDREEEIKKFKPQEFWTIEANLIKTKKQENIKTRGFVAKLIKQNDKVIPKLGIKSKDEAGKILKDLEGAKYQVLDIKKKEIKRTPPPPFITSTLQQEAIRKFGFSAKQTMVLAQQLYEGIEIEGKSEGLITYMRTDSFNLSKEALSSAQKIIKQKFGKEYALTQPRIYKTKSKSAQEAHEAIRPTNLSREPKSIKNYLDERQFKLYDLIWKRTLACQMKEVTLDSTSVDIKACLPVGKAQSAERKDQNFYTFRATGSVIKFDGFTKVYTEEGTKNIFREAILPPLEIREDLDLIKLKPTQHFTEPPPRYSEASLVAALEKYGIGRPSTYAPILSTIQERGYVEKIERRFHPKGIGILVNNILIKHFPQIVDIKFTAEMEEDLDLIAQAKKEWVKILSSFYGPFEKNLLEKGKELSKKDLIEEKTEKKCPKCGKFLVIKLGRFGKFYSCSDFPKCKYTEPLEGEKIKEELTSEKCGKCGALMKIKVGRFGKFLACSKYPECKFTKPIINSTGIKCPKCSKGEIIEKKTKKGRTFYACNRYPKCDFAMWQKPTKEKCPKCKSLLSCVGKNKIKCSNKECDFEKEIEKK